MDLYRDTKSGAVVSLTPSKKEQKNLKRKKDAELANRLECLTKEVEDMKRMFRDCMASVYNNKEETT